MTDKLDPGLAAHLRGLTGSAEDADHCLRVMVALSRPVSESDAARLKAAGLDIGSTLGDIVTGTITLQNLETLAADPLVLQIEGGRSLETE